MFAFELGGCGFESHCSHLRMTDHHITLSPMSDIMYNNKAPLADIGIFCQINFDPTSK